MTSSTLPASYRTRRIIVLALGPIGHRIFTRQHKGSSGQPGASTTRTNIQTFFTASSQLYRFPQVHCFKTRLCIYFEGARSRGALLFPFFLPSGYAMVHKSALVVLLVVVLMMQQHCQGGDVGENHPSSALTTARRLQNINCGSACDYRCSKADAHDRCIKYCNICCGKCNCVPPGTYGNKETCPCYNNLKNSKGGPKCP
ncbi:uncharacterized protein LOC9649775 isoform X2 [Selaginella moellendorffii]|uniref:uncharacterized protein LOC9649775 isoform X2 n=1 Tax=Selaginella moellendorffii TaxID=88036 RepID=UPI000D1CF6AE|nr:uncharacterized protein LOC9649775 isoform X2 [Selaginella moellendorffii]|eukprot:XP_024537243.1 uncharacterized protein LOC9649775 isoform X2 [Selaginella moellendorffii]